MRAIEYFAPEAFGAWAKVGFLFENGVFLCAFSYHNAPSYICRNYDFNNAPERMTWVKVVDFVT